MCVYAHMSAFIRTESSQELSIRITVNGAQHDPALGT